MAAAVTERPLKLSRIPHISQETTRAENEPLAAYLSTRVGRKIALDVPKDYDAVIDGLVRGDVDIAILAPFAYVVAKRRMPELTLLAQLVAEGSGQYMSYIVTAADSPAKTLGDLRGKRFAFVDKRSTTGYLLPMDLLLSAGIRPARDFSHVVFAGSHPDVVNLVLKHKVDGGAIASTTFGQMRDARLTDRLRIIGKSDPVPLDVVVTRPGLDAAITTLLRTTLLDLSTRTEEGRAVLTSIQTLSNGFVSVNDSAYDGVRRIVDKVDAAP
jgi:phosphonate transport system substrate-binding protein